MSLFKWFKREGGKVGLTANSGLDVAAYNYSFSWNCNDENYAELLKERLNQKLLEFKREIARDATMYLSKQELSSLKRRLKDWDSRKEHWK